MIGSLSVSPLLPSFLMTQVDGQIKPMDDSMNPHTSRRSTSKTRNTIINLLIIFFLAINQLLVLSLEMFEICLKSQFPRAQGRDLESFELLEWHSIQRYMKRTKSPHSRCQKQQNKHNFLLPTRSRWRVSREVSRCDQPLRYFTALHNVNITATQSHNQKGKRRY